MSVLIRGGRIVTAADDYVADLYVEDETITLIGESIDMPADKVIKNPQNAKAYDATLAKAALQYLKNHVKGIDVKGTSYKPITVTLKAGGK